jgi:hypothetical protein
MSHPRTNPRHQRNPVQHHWHPLHQSLFHQHQLLEQTPFKNPSLLYKNRMVAKARTKHERPNKTQPLTFCLKATTTRKISAPACYFCAATTANLSSKHHDAGARKKSKASCQNRGLMMSNPKPEKPQKPPTPTPKTPPPTTNPNRPRIDIGKKTNYRT